jgi:hypothetical protein
VLGLSIKTALALIALAIGVYLGLPGRYTQTPDDIEQMMESGGGRRRKVKRVFTPLAWLQRKASARTSQRLERKSFRLESPDDR